MRIRAVLLVCVLMLTLICIPPSAHAASHEDVALVLLTSNSSATEKMVSAVVSGRNILPGSSFEDEDMVSINAIDEYTETDIWSFQTEGTLGTAGVPYGRDGKKNGIRMESAPKDNAGLFVRMTIPGNKYYYFSIWMRLESGSSSGRQLALSVYDNKNADIKNGSKARYSVDLGSGESALGSEWKEYSFILYIPEEFNNFYFEPRIYTPSGSAAAEMVIDLADAELYEAEIVEQETEKAPEVTQEAEPDIAEPEKDDTLIRDIKPRPGKSLPPISSLGFSDLGEVSWAVPAIEEFYSLGIVSGVNDREFKPNDNVTREQFAKLMISAFEWETDARCSFVDVAEDSWSYPYIAAAYEYGLVKGINETEFGVNEFITRQDMAVMVYRALEAIGIQAGQGGERLDGEGIDDYAIDAVSGLCAEGIFYMLGGSIQPLAYATRVDAVTVLYNACMYMTGQKDRIIRAD